MRIRIPSFGRLNERGDTIVEVLISIAVISLILGGAYVATNRSLQATRDAQEHGDALKLVESQIEQIKGIGPAQLFKGVASPYCIANGVVVAGNNAACKVDARGVASAEEPVYTLVINRSGNDFTVTNTWTSNKGTQNKVEMKYRSYEN